MPCRPFPLLAGTALLAAGLGCRMADTEAALLRSRDQWTRSIAQLGLVPVFPPREDVQVGDIYLFTYNPEAPDKAEGEAASADKDWSLHPSRWQQVKKVNELLKEEYRMRPSFRETPGLGASTPGSSDVVDEGGQPRRLRIVALPDFVGATFMDSTSLSRSLVHNGIVPAETLNLLADPMSSRISMVSMKIPSAESYALAQADLLNELVDQSAGEKHLRSPYRESIQWVAHRGRIWLRVVAEVFYARNMDITVEFEGKSAPSGTDGFSMVRTDTEAKVKDRVASLNDSLQANGSTRLPGGSIRYINASERRVALRRTWERGVAVGFRGFTLEIDPAKNEVVSVIPLNAFNPALKPRTL
jgi:hypothetical protein